MAVWKQRGRGNRHPSYTPLGHDPSELDHLVDLLAAKPENEDMRRQLGDAMEAADVSDHRGWVAENRIVNAKTVPGREAEAAAWPTARGLAGVVLHEQVVPIELSGTGSITALTGTNALTLTIGRF